ncbi:methyltransferase-like protein 7A [Folsomia candida]|uniref:Methyltransferase-like protein 7A n=1 Tax=Folsomia candida TaxID=158441 RepID=A0A226EVZ5_FOLCA|nr:methyltransferase-like protein 7A [Folsomia candida]OXA60776.1 Methyltransferase-like protein 7A [Folsomia candida]
MSVLLVVSALIVVLAIVYQKWLYKYIGSDNRKKYFAELLKDFPKLYNPKTKPMKQKLFESLIKTKEEICVLEIGIGSGGNFDFYPESKCRLIANEPNQYFHQILSDNVAKYPQIILSRISSSSADNLQDIGDATIDAVISTVVLCSVPNVANTLDAILRVLKPGGKFYYMEHELDPKFTWWRKLQEMIDFFGIWTFLFDGCHASRTTGNLIKDSGLLSVDQDRFYLNPVGFWGLYIIKPHVYGVAMKTAIKSEKSLDL